MDATEATTATEPAGPPASASRPIAPAVVAIMLGAGLLVFGTLHLGAALTALPGEAVLWRLRTADGATEADTVRPPDDTDLTAAAAALAASGNWRSQGTTETDRGYLLTRRAGQLPPGPQRRAALEEAAAATAAGLAAAPAQPSAWARLAHLRLSLGQPQAAAEALRLSFYAGAVVPPLMASRLALGLALWDHLDPPLRHDLRRQVRLAWLVDPDAVGALAADSRHAPFILAALEELSPEEQALFARRFARDPAARPSR